MKSRSELLVGICLLVAALVFYYGAVLRIDYTKTIFLDLRPYTDAAEYFAEARALSQGKPPRIQIGYEKLPAKVPFGYPALVVPWLKCLPESQAVLAPFRTNQTIGLLLVLAVFGLYLYLEMPLSGGIAALLLATLPGFYSFCRSSMSDISACALFVLAFSFVYLGFNEERRWKIYLAAFLLGLSVNIRPQSLFFAPLVSAMMLFPSQGSRLRWLAHCAGAGAVFFLGASPVLIMNTVVFHSPLQGGYTFWTPTLVGQDHALFSVKFIPDQLAMLWSNLSLTRTVYNIFNFFGTGTFFVPAYILLVGIGLFFLRINRFIICAFFGGLSFFTVTATCMFPDGRLYLPLLILLVSVAALPVVWAVQNLRGRVHRLSSLCILLLFGATCLGYPSQSGFRAGSRNGRVQSWDALHFTSPPRQSPHYIAMKHFTQTFRQRPGVVFSDFDPVFLNALLPKPFVAAPLDEKHHYNWTNKWHYGAEEAAALVKKSVDQSLPVYALFASLKEKNQASPRLPFVPNRQWKMVDFSKEAVVLQLVPAG